MWLRSKAASESRCATVVSRSTLDHRADLASNSTESHALLTSQVYHHIAWHIMIMAYISWFSLFYKILLFFRQNFVTIYKLNLRIKVQDMFAKLLPLFVPRWSRGCKHDLWARDPGFDSRVEQSVIGFFHEDFLNSSHVVWMCIRLMVIGSLLNGISNITCERVNY